MTTTEALRRLAVAMRAAALKMSLLTSQEARKHAQELERAAALADTWADGMEEEG